mgnify:FL=1
MAFPALVKILGNMASKAAVAKSKGSDKKKKPKINKEKLFQRKPAQPQDGETFVYSGREVSAKSKVISTSAIDKAKNLSNQKENTSSYIKKALDSINSVAGSIWESLKSRNKSEKGKSKRQSLPRRMASSIFSAPLRIGKKLVTPLIKHSTKFFGSIMMGIGALVLVTYIDEIMGIFKMIVKVVGAGARLLVGIFNFMIDKIYPAVALFLPKAKQAKQNVESLKELEKEIDKSEKEMKDNGKKDENVSDSGKDTKTITKSETITKKSNAVAKGGQVTSGNMTNDQVVDNRIKVLEFKRDSRLTPAWQKKSLQEQINRIEKNRATGGYEVVSSEDYQKQVKEGKAFDFNQGGLVQNFNQGGIVTDPEEKKQQEDYMLKWVNKERVEFLGLPPLKKLTYADGVELTKMMGPEYYGGGIEEKSNTDSNFDTMTKSAWKTKSRGNETLFRGSKGMLTEEDKQNYLASNPQARLAQSLHQQLELDALGMDISATSKMNEGGLVRGKGGVDKIRANLTQGEFVISAPAVRKFGVETFKAMNAAAGSSSIPTISMDGSINAKDGAYIGDEKHVGKEWGEDTPKLVEVIGPSLMQWMKMQNEQVEGNPDAYGGIKLTMDRDGKMPNFGKFIADMSEQGFNQAVDSIRSNEAMEPPVKEAVLKKMSWIKQETLRNPNFKSDIAFDINKDIPGTQANRILIAAQQDTTSPAAKAGFSYVERARLLNRTENKKKITEQIKNVSVDTEDDSEEEDLNIPLPPSNQGGGISGKSSSPQATFIPIKIDNIGELTKQALYKE